jgi:hypothetical protein
VLSKAVTYLRASRPRKNESWGSSCAFGKPELTSARSASRTRTWLHAVVHGRSRPHAQGHGKVPNLGSWEQLQEAHAKQPEPAHPNFKRFALDTLGLTDRVTIDQFVTEALAPSDPADADSRLARLVSEIVSGSHLRSE